MKNTNTKYFNLTVDKLGDFLSSGKINYELFIELVGLLYWALDEQHKEVASSLERDNSQRAFDNNFIDTVLSGYKLSFRLKDFIDSMLVIPLRLLVHRITFIKRKIWNVQASKIEKLFLRVLMAKVNDLENEVLEVTELLSQYHECKDDEDIRRLFEELSDED